MAWSVFLAQAFNLLPRLWSQHREKKLRVRDDEWAKKFTDAIFALSNALPRTLSDGPAGFAALVPDKETRTRIETYLIEPERSSYSGATVKARTLSPEHLRSSAVQRTIQDVLDCVEKLKRENPDIARRLRL
jgi:hypothetical protein